MMASSNELQAQYVTEARALVSELCRQFYTLGWVSGTGGSISMKVNIAALDNAERIIVMAPSGVQKERMLPEDMYVLAPDGAVLEAPVQKPAPHKPVKLSECHPLFMAAFQLRNAGACIHSHGMESCLVTMLDPGATTFRITHMEMIKGIAGHGYYDELVVPIIENTARETELTESLTAAIKAYPRATAVLVRNHGVYVWGDSWISAKTQAECYHYLFEAAIRLHQLGLDPADPLHGPRNPAVKGSGAQLLNGPSTNGAGGKRSHAEMEGKAATRAVVLDIEGTTTPISFVADVLFPYAQAHVRDHLMSTYAEAETQEDIAALRAQIEADVAAHAPGSVAVPPASAGGAAVVDALAANVAAMISADRKVTALKQLQGHIWRTGYACGRLLGEMFEDVPSALQRWTQAGIKVYIYSSGSREAQRLIFGYTKHGDLRRFLSGFFDTTVGHKREAPSYREISLSLGVDSPSEITFATDIYEEAKAARAAGMEAVLLVRPGNKPLPDQAAGEFRVVTSLLDLLPK